MKDKMDSLRGKSPPVQRMSPVRIILQDGSYSKKKHFKTVFWVSTPILAQKEVCYWIMSSILFILFKDGIFSVLQRKGTEAFQ